MSAAELLCALCARRPATTREHVPAKGLFPKPRPNDLITVPACDPCNAGSSEDDEHLKAYFALGYEAERTPALDKIRASVTRALVREDFGGLKESFARRISFQYLPGVGGTVLTLQPRLTPDRKRVHGVIAKSVRGLFYYVTGRILPPEVEVLVVADHQADKMPPLGQRAVQRWVHIARSGVTGRRGEGVFGYALRVTDDNPNSFAAGVIFYRSFSFIAAAVSPNHGNAMVVVPPPRNL